MTPPHKADQMGSELKIGGLAFDKYSGCGWNGWVLQGLGDISGRLESWLAPGGSQVLAESLCRKVAFCWLDGRKVFLKIMWAQNDGAVKKHELTSLAKWALGPSRAVGILKVTSRMLAEGLLCPVPIAGLRRRVSSGRHINLLATWEVTAPTVESILQSGSRADAAEAVKTSAEELARLHSRHFVHGDFLPRNACLDSSGFYFLDNDKTWHWPFMPPWFLRVRNLEQFAYNLMLQGGLETCDMELPGCFLDAYAAASSVNVDRGRLLSRARARWERRRMRAGGARVP